jgi:hypothetical protein
MQNLFILQENLTTDILKGIVGIALCIGLFMLLRGIMLWYWKVDVVVKELQEMNWHLRILTGRNPYDKNPKATTPTKLGVMADAPQAK